MSQMLSFKQYPSKHVQPLNLNVINTFSTNKSIEIEEIQRDARLDRIDSYRLNLGAIINSKTKSGVKSTYDGNQIKDMLYDILNTKKIPAKFSKKNDAIDEIVRYFTESYHPRKKVDTTNIGISNSIVTYIKDEDEDEL